MSEAVAKRPGLTRRGLLLSGAAAAGGIAVGAVAPDRTVGDPGAADRTRERVPFRGPHQAGITTSPQAFAAMVAFDLRAGMDREALVRLMRIWTDDIERLMGGRAGLTDTEPELAGRAARLSVTLGFGARVFDVPGLRDRRPTWLGPLPAFAIDRLQDRWSGGDLVLQVCADEKLTVAHAVRVLSKEATSFTTVRWVQHGFRSSPEADRAGVPMRNLMGQVDGTRNLEPELHDRLLWVGDASRREFGAQPDWLTGGTSMVVRRISMQLDRWDELDRTAREKVIGRRLSDGSVLTGTRLSDEPDLHAVDDLGLEVIEPYAHIRRARSDDARQRFLRRPYNYDVAPEPGQISNAGLLFVTYQADVAAQFVPIQQRLSDLDLLGDWTTPIGSAVFAVPPGCPDGEFLAQGLLT